ncbi:hypothetical protein C8J57DRAFT_1222161 [Mycena rebaudengoi]|nr:hypothetical protein C8J57DRAFT_1222161 [Mycena rebaudengoi]
MLRKGIEPPSSHDLIVQIAQKNGEGMIDQRSTEAFLLLFEDGCFNHPRLCLERDSNPHLPAVELVVHIPTQVTGTIHHDPPRLSCTIYAADMCGGSYTLIPHHNLNLNQARQFLASRLIMTKSSVSFSGWFFLPPTETDVVLVHLRLELLATDDNDHGYVDDIQPRPCTTRLSAPRLAHKVADHIPSPTPRSRTNSLFDSPAGGSPHRSTLSIDNLKPNAHPHPIRTTSTALLIPSNSTSSQQQNRGRHHCLPPPSHPSPHRERTSSSASANGDGNGGGSGGKAAGERRGEYRGHRYSRSLSSSEGMAYGGVAAESPRALPVPPGFARPARRPRAAARVAVPSCAWVRRSWGGLVGRCGGARALERVSPFSLKDISSAPADSLPVHPRAPLVILHRGRRSDPLLGAVLRSWHGATRLAYCSIDAPCCLRCPRWRCNDARDVREAADGRRVRGGGGGRPCDGRRQAPRRRCDDVCHGEGAGRRPRWCCDAEGGGAIAGNHPMSEGRRRREGLARPQARRRWRGDDARWFYGLLEGRSRHPTLCDGRGGLMMWWKRAIYARWMTWRARCGWRYGGTTCRRGHASYVRVRMGGCGAPPTEDDTERGRGLLGGMQWADTCMAGRVHGPRVRL